MDRRRVWDLLAVFGVVFCLVVGFGLVRHFGWLGSHHMLYEFARVRHPRVWLL